MIAGRILYQDCWAMAETIDLSAYISLYEGAWVYIRGNTPVRDSWCTARTYMLNEELNTNIIQLKSELTSHVHILSWYRLVQE